MKELQAEESEISLRAAESLRREFHRELLSPFNRAVREYRLIKPGDRIAVCISGGKDSMLMAMCMKHLQKYSEIPFEARYIVMDPGYNPVNREKIIRNAAALEIPIEIFESTIFDAVADIEKNPCYLCARMRRGYLYSRAEDLGCNKIALGHHFDDVIETILMGVIYGAQFQTMMPKLHSSNFTGMELIRPLYMVREADIIAWARYNGLEFLQCACRFTEKCAEGDGTGVSKRREIKELLCRLRADNPLIDMNIFRSAENVNLETVISYHKGDEYHSFLDDYSQKRGGSENDQ